MKESTLFSQRWIYENIFGLSQDEWTSEQVEERFESVFGNYETGYESTFTVPEHEFLRDLTDDEREELR